MPDSIDAARAAAGQQRMRRCCRGSGGATRRPGQVATAASVLDPVVGQVGVRTAQPRPVPDAHQPRAVSRTVQADAGRWSAGVVQT